MRIKDKDKWLEAIEKSMKSKTYGDTKKCELCKVVKDHELDTPKCEICICRKYLNHLYPRYNLPVKDSLACVYLVTIADRLSTKSIDFHKTEEVRNILRDMKSWLTELCVENYR